MGKPAAVAISSKWISSKGTVVVVLERKPFGILEYQIDGRAIFGSSKQSDFLRNFKPFVQPPLTHQAP